MPERIWFRSLYWRVAVGFVAFLAAMLVVQFGVLFWLVARATDEVAGRTPHDLATLVASDIAAAMAAEPLGDPGAYLKEHYGGVTRPVALVMADGRVFVSKDRVELPPPMVEMALRRLRGPRRPAGEGPPAQGGTGRPPGTGVPLPNQPPLGTMGRGFGSGRGIGPGTGMGPGGGMGPGEGMGPGGGPAGQNAPGPRPPGVRTRALGMAPVFHDGQLVAMVIVPPTEHLPTLLREFAPMAAAIGLVLLVVATTLAAIVVFRPAQRRLAALEVAARQLGAGVLTARAPVAGGDEVTSVARAFNAMADELDRRASALIAASETRRQLLADVSHELMTPLTAIRGYLETLQMPELQLDPDARQRYLGIVSAESERLERIIGDLVDLARLEAGGGSLAREDVEVATLFRRVMERHERDAAEKGVTLACDVGAEAETVEADGGRLEQVLQNLAANALRHTPAGGTVELRSARSADGIVLRVRDTGEGIPPEHLPRVFDRFYKADEARGANGRGSGLGLSIAKAIVERHGGRISVRSDPGRETVFEIVLPVSASTAAG
jgi:two-component system sensor histidine kinase BaeS